MDWKRTTGAKKRSAAVLNPDGYTFEMNKRQRTKPLTIPRKKKSKKTLAVLVGDESGRPPPPVPPVIPMKRGKISINSKVSIKSNRPQKDVVKKNYKKRDGKVILPFADDDDVKSSCYINGVSSQREFG